jgi:two-component system sensor histidine kinase DesK
MPNLIRVLLRTEPFVEGEDPDGAPLAYCGDQPARPWTPRRWVQNLGFIFVTGLLFMGFAITPLLDGDPSPLVIGLRVTLLIIICLAYGATPLLADTSLAFRWCYLGAFVLLIAATASYQGWGFVYLGVYVAVVAASLLPWRYARGAVLIWSLAVLVVMIPLRELTPMMISGMSLLAGWGLGISFEAIRIRQRLSAARQRVAVLAVEAERERIARDLHDILGHSLTAISIKSGLAARLAEQDPAAARAQMTEVEQIARVALNDVRATTTGLREVRLALEIAGARSVLMAAGVEAVTPSAVPPMSVQASELLGYVVREAVTNVVRHAEATRCVIAIEDRAVTITDDGTGIRRSGRQGTGLAGLRNRLGTAGGRLIIEPAESGGTVLRAELPATPQANPTVSQSSEEVIRTP